jgi:hypothetical protein
VILDDRTTMADALFESSIKSLPLIAARQGA